MKLLGIILIFFSFACGGIISGNRYILFLEEIKRAEMLLKNIIFCLKKERMTVLEILDKCSVLCDEKTKDFLFGITPKNFPEIGKLAEKRNFCSEKNANYILQEAFSVLGKYSAEDQISELEFCRKKLENLYLKNEENFISKARLLKNSGFLAGAFFVIILV